MRSRCMLLVFAFQTLKDAMRRAAIGDENVDHSGTKCAKNGLDLVLASGNRDYCLDTLKLLPGDRCHRGVEVLINDFTIDLSLIHI